LRPLRTSYLIGARVVKAVPDRTLDALVRAGGTAWFHLSRGQHDAALDNYAAVLRLPRDHPDVRRTATRAFHNYGRMIADFTRIPALDSEEVSQLMTYSGTEHIDAALEEGRGAILALPHMGSWDVAGTAAGVLGYDIHAVAETFPGSLNDAVVEGREHLGLKVIPLGRAAVPRLIEILQQNKVAALLTDIAHGRGVEVEMFERRVELAAGPASLALRTGAALLPVAVWATGPSRYHGHVEPELVPVITGNRKHDIKVLSQRLAHIFERLIRAHPDNWYAFKPILRTAAA
jgi:phosphatidylinositol dimannoside acyltransferase